MTDTPEHIKALQLKIWLSKPPGERLLQFLKDNEAMYLAFKEHHDKEKMKCLLPLEEGNV